MQFVQVVKPYLAVQDGGHTGVHALLRLGSDKCAALLSATIKEKENLGRSPF